MVRRPSVRTHLHARSTGQVLVIAALFLTAVLGMVGLAVDAGMALAGRRHLQKVASTCVVEGAQPNDSSTWVARATACVTSNGLAAGDIEYVRTPPQDPTSRFNGRTGFLELKLRRDQPTFFARIIGVSTIPQTGRAVAGGNTPAEFALMGLRPGIDGINCNGCSSTDIVGGACTGGYVDANGNGLQINGIMAANQGPSGGSSSNWPQSPPAQLQQPGPACADPNYPLPSPLPNIQDTSGLSGTLCIGGPTPCPNSGATVSCPANNTTGTYPTSGNPAQIYVECTGTNQTVQVRGPRQRLETTRDNEAQVYLLGSTSSPQTAQFQTVVLDGDNSSPTYKLMPGYYDTIEIKARQNVRFKKGLYLITSGLYVNGSNASLTIDNVANPDDTTQTGVSLVIGLFFSIDSNSTVNLANNGGCCATQMANRVQVYHLGGCATPYSSSAAGSPGTPLKAWSGNTCTTASSPFNRNHMEWGGNNDASFGGSIYSPYLCSSPYPSSCNSTTAPVNGFPQANTLPQVACYGGSEECMLIHGSAGTGVQGQVIGPSMKFSGNGLDVSFTPSATISARVPYLAE